MKNIDGVWYNINAISEMTFEDFRALYSNYTADKARNIYIKVTGRKPEKKDKVKKEEK